MDFSTFVPDTALKAITSALLLAVMIGIATLIVVQAVKTPVRALFHMDMTRRWFKRREQNAAALNRVTSPEWLAELVGSSPVQILEFELREWHRAFWTTQLPRLLGLMPFTSTNFYLKNLQNIAQRALEHPAENGWFFAYLAADANIIDKVVAYQVDAKVQRDPKLLEVLTIREDSTDRGVAATIAAAQDNVSTAVDRALDDLQIRMIFWWPILMRLTGLIIAFGLTAWLIFGASAQPASPPLLFVLGVGFASAYIASFIYDVLNLLASFRPRQQ